MRERRPPRRTSSTSSSNICRRSGPFENIHVQVFYSAVELPDNPPGETQQPQVRGIVTYLVPLL